MPFEIYRGKVEAANKLPVEKGPTLYKQKDKADMWDDRFHSRSPKSKKHKQTSSKAVIYINEPGGLDVTVIYRPPKRRAKAARRARTSLSNHQRIRVSADEDNLWRGSAASPRILPDLEAKLPSGWQSGKRRIKFTLSKCSPDRFIVTHRHFREKQWWASHLVVEVRKRIQCHLFEMRSSSRAKTGDTIDHYRPIIGRAQKIYSDLAGIDLVFADDKVEPEREIPFHVNRNRNQVFALRPGNRGPRDLYLIVVHNFTGNAVGWGGNGVAAVEDAEFRTTKAQLQRVERAATRGATVGGGAYWQRVWQWMRDEPTVATVDFLDTHARTITLIHEIGHAFGLVPTNEEAGGVQWRGWEDAGNAGHCSRTSCAMFHEAELGQLPLMRSLTSPPFDHYDALSDFGEPGGCNLFLRTALLDDIR